jgi:hypothetical protein
MQEVLMFNRKTREQRYMSSANHQEIERLREEGWLNNPKMIHMHHPLLRKDESIPIDERKQWEEKGYFAEPTIIYHPNQGGSPKTEMVSSEDAKRALKNGWYASPAQFPGNDIGKIKTAGIMKEAS